LGLRKAMTLPDLILHTLRTYKNGDLAIFHPMLGVTRYYWLAFKTENEIRPLIYFKKSKFITQKAYEDLFDQISFLVKKKE